MRCGFDGLAALVRNTLCMDSLSGSLYLFLGKKCDQIKILFLDHDGYALYSKRLERGRFPNLSLSHSSSGKPVYHIAAYELPNPYPLIRYCANKALSATFTSPSPINLYQNNDTIRTAAAQWIKNFKKTKYQE